MRISGRNVSFVADRHLPLLFYLALSGLFLNYYRYQLDPDSISYISIAQQYLKGDYADAINGLWSPLISWILVPFLAIKLSPQLAAKVVSVLVGIFVLSNIRKLLSHFKLAPSVTALYMLSFCPLIAWYALYDGCPDLLGLGILLLYLCLITNDAYFDSKYSGLACGLLGAAAYLSKSYNFYFFLLHFTLINLCYLLFKCSPALPPKRVLYRYLAGMITFLAISSVWIDTLSHKYHHFTISTAGNYNMAINAPGVRGDYPMDTDGLIAPPNASAISSWDDPSYQHFVKWNPFGTLQDFSYLLKIAISNVVGYFYKVSSNPLYFFTIVFISIAFFTSRKRHDDKAYYLFLTTMIYPLGYYLMHIEERYLWINNVLLYVLSAYVLSFFLQKSLLNTSQGKLIMAAVAMYMIATPLHHLLTYTNIDKDVYVLGQEIKGHLNLERANVAGQADSDQGEDWRKFLSLSYYLHDRYFGIVRKDESDDDVKRDLVRNRIQYYFVDGKLKNNLDILKPEVTVKGLTIYRVLLPPA
ncbi:MAG TPA: hypothetical protein VJ550_11460 [Geomonas sp.]|nr:hypothetical protein [Geomonas sp.]